MNLFSQAKALDLKHRQTTLRDTSLPGVPDRIYQAVPEVKLIYVVRDPVSRLVSHFVHNSASGREDRTFEEVIGDVENNYFKTSMYFFQLEAYLKYFKSENILILDSAQLRDETVTTMRNVFKFLNVNPIENAEVLTRKFHVAKTKQSRSKLAYNIGELTTNRYLRRISQRILRPFRTEVTTPQLTDEQHAYLVSVFKNDVEKLRDFSGIQFETWDL